MTLDHLSLALSLPACRLLGFLRLPLRTGSQDRKRDREGRRGEGRGYRREESGVMPIVKGLGTTVTANDDDDHQLMHHSAKRAAVTSNCLSIYIVRVATPPHCLPIEDGVGIVRVGTVRAARSV